MSSGVALMWGTVIVAVVLGVLAAAYLLILSAGANASLGRY